MVSLLANDVIPVGLIEPIYLWAYVYMPLLAPLALIYFI